jgi:hypothetical protein
MTDQTRGELLALCQIGSLEDFEPRNTEEALMALRYGTMLERKVEDLPDWVLFFSLASDDERFEIGQALAPVKATKTPPSSHTPVSHTTRARTSWGLGKEPERWLKIRLLAHCAPLFVQRRLYKVGRLVEIDVRAPSEKAKARIEATWDEIRKYAMRWLEDHEADCDAIADEMLSELARLRSKIGDRGQCGGQCGARCRSGAPCRMKAYVWPDGRTTGRCRLHGGATPHKPKSPAGRAAIAAANRARAQEKRQA